MPCGDQPCRQEVCAVCSSFNALQLKLAGSLFVLRTASNPQCHLSITNLSISAALLQRMGRSKPR